MPNLLLFPLRGYLPITNTTFPKLPQHVVFVNQTLNNGLENLGAASKGFIERRTQVGYSYLKPLSIDIEVPFKDRETKSITDKQRLPKEIKDSYKMATTRIPEISRPSNVPRLRAEDARVPWRKSYQVVEESDEYLTVNSDYVRLPYREKVQTIDPHRDSQDITTAIKTLDRFLNGVLNSGSSNSDVHPPLNPVFALILSRYGRYVFGAQNPRVYAYMAANNIHNNKPFGNYKVEYEEVPTYV
ncbi:PREDICTED: uncharacterized protein LOC107192121 [Dufourea novaeangliae]|uniref:uncharacterized protein LOC107192121 n=1 Tax=Dufourea novaeangliae TaxID=178035 RepID=UPI000767866C|nr:PREDICTED: uncharacterized protein LOC107192121 [Dufourea novaeangliae]